MGSGNSRIIINPLERAVSNDINRLESMLSTSAGEYSRWLVNREIGGDFFNYPGESAAYLALPPNSDFLVAHDCISGLMVRPDNAGSLIIDPGEGGFFVPAFLNATADDTKYVRVSDAGVQSLGVLTWTANGGAGVRWDIVECQPTEALLESSSRDIYNTTTGLFTPAVVQKVRAGALTYRIRLGTPAGGVPPIANDWMPLAAIHTRTDSTGFLDSDVYDIRPLVNERTPFGINHPTSPPAPTSGIGYRAVLYESELSHVDAAGMTGKALTGYFRSHFAGYWSGGAIRRNTPSGSAATFGLTTALAGNTPYFNPAATENRSSSYAIVGDDRFTIGAHFPRGYPRWVRYSQLALTPSNSNRLRKAGRLPQGPRGILMISKDSGSGDGIIFPQNMPTAFGIVSVSMVNNSDGPALDLPFQNQLAGSTLVVGDILDGILRVWVPLFTSASGFDDASFASTINRLSVVCFHSVAPSVSVGSGFIAGYQL
jgi:hypothetical protein